MGKRLINKLKRWTIEEESAGRVLRHMKLNKDHCGYGIRADKGHWICGVCKKKAPREIQDAADLCMCKEYCTTGFRTYKSLEDLLLNRYITDFAAKIQMANSPLYQHLKRVKNVNSKNSSNGFSFMVKREKDEKGT